MSESEQDFLERRDDFDERPVPRKEGMSGCAIAAIGCGAMLVLLLIVGGFGAWWVANNARAIGSDLAAQVLKGSLRELDLPPDQQKRIDARIDDVAQQFKEEKLTGDDVGRIFQKISQGPLMPAGLALFVKRVYIRDSGLSEDEKAAAEVSIHRFARGVIDESIPETERESVLDTISTKNAQGQREFKNNLSDDEVRTFVDAAKQAADDAGVAEEVPEINFADEFDKAVDEALSEAGQPFPIQELAEPELLESDAAEAEPATPDAVEPESAEPDAVEAEAGESASAS